MHVGRYWSFFTAPGPVGNLQAIYPAVIWQSPEMPNGIISSYKLVFTSDQGGSTTTVTENIQTHFVIEKDTLPNLRNLAVQVSLGNSPLINSSCTHHLYMHLLLTRFTKRPCLYQSTPYIHTAGCCHQWSWRGRELMFTQNRPQHQHNTT